jgi:hypothetical protein
MTATQMQLLIGMHGYLDLKGKGLLTARVRILDVRDGGWGRTLVQVTPIMGMGTEWRDLDSLDHLTALPAPQI